MSTAYFLIWLGLTGCLMAVMLAPLTNRKTNH